MSGTKSGVQCLENESWVKLSQDCFYQMFGCKFCLEGTLGEECKDRNSKLWGGKFISFENYASQQTRAERMVACFL